MINHYSKTIEQAKTLWDFMSADNQIQPSDALVVCCSYDLQVCDYACDMVKAGYANTLLFSGNRGNWTNHLWSRSEALIFRDRALARGIADHQIILEQQATNLGENITFSRDLLPDARRVTFISKPNSLLRLKLTIPVQWPEITGYFAAPKLQFPEDISNMIGVLGVIHEMVGDLQRIQTYAEQGYQIPCKIPPSIQHIGNELIQQGFTQHLV